jgi:peptidoglycan/xylan/chitin deacetylase (PgdA/CDA1 family)
MRCFAALLALVFCLQAFTQPSRAETRVALVIGNGAYQDAPRLPNPPNDAEDVVATLRRNGFDIISGSDLNRAAMEDAAIRFARAARTADVAMFYYSGHAIQFAGVNYLAPVDIQLRDEADLRRMIRLDDIVADLQQARNVRILVLDACRDNPLADELKRSIGATRALPLQRGLAKIDTPQGMIVAYATQAGRTADDGIGRNSPYTSSFLKHVEEQEEIGTFFRHVSIDVYEATKHAQLPEYTVSLTGEFYLNGRVSVTTATKPNSEAPTAPQEQAKPKEAPLSTIPLNTVIEPLKSPTVQLPNCLNKNALGVSRIITIDSTGGPGFGFEHFKQNDILHDKEVVLTFEDGPWPINTPSVLKALADECTTGIFFPIGKHATYYPEILKQVAAAGHTIGSHTWSHATLTNKNLTEDQRKDEIEKGFSADKWALDGVSPAPFFRFPALQNPPEMVTYLGSRNIAIFSCDLDSFDFKARTSEEVVNVTMSKLDKLGKGIILLHDFHKHTAEGLPGLLRRLKAGGYKVVQIKAKLPLITLLNYDEAVARDMGRPLSAR